MKYVTKTVLLAGAVTLGIVTAHAAGDPIANRKALMQSVGAATKASASMVKGKVPFDAVKAELAMRTIHAAGLGFGSFFPENSKTGGKTTAAPKIWEDMAGFAAIGNNMVAASAEGIKAAKAGEAAFKGAFGKVAANCKKCHQTYRVKKK